MPRRTLGGSRRSPATDQAEGREPHPATQLRGHGEGGAVRPADNRFLDPEEIALRDAYVAQETGETAQQLVVKAEDPEHVEALSSADAGHAKTDDDQN